MINCPQPRKGNGECILVETALGDAWTTAFKSSLDPEAHRIPKGWTWESTQKNHTRSEQTPHYHAWAICPPSLSVKLKKTRCFPPFLRFCHFLCVSLCFFCFFHVIRALMHRCPLPNLGFCLILVFLSHICFVDIINFARSVR